MTSERTNTWAVCLSVLGGFFLGTLLLAGMMAGFILVIMMTGLMLLGAPVLMAVCAIEKLRERHLAPAAQLRPATATGIQGAPTLLAPTPASPPLLQQAPAADVSMRVVAARGTCPLGYSFQVGDEFVFANGTAAPQLCRRAQQKLQPIVSQVRAGQYSTITLPYCKTKHHLVVFELQKKKAAVPVH